MIKIKPFRNFLRTIGRSLIETSLPTESNVKTWAKIKGKKKKSLPDGVREKSRQSGLEGLRSQRKGI